MASCKMYVTKKFDLQTYAKPKTKEEYRVLINKKKVFKNSNVLYIDSVCYAKFLREKYFSTPSPILIGCFANDSLLCKKSKDFYSNTSCVMKIEKEVEACLLNDSTSLTTEVALPKLSTYSFRWLQNDSAFKFENKNNGAIVLLAISFKFGTYYDELFERIKMLSNKINGGVSIYFIIIDPLYKLK